MRSGFFNNTLVTAEDFAHFARGMATNGVLMETGDEMEITAGSSGMEFSSAPGYCWINGRFGHAEAAETVTLSNGHGTYPRKDRITARLDLDANTISYTVIEGVPADSPTAPAIVRNSSIYDLGLAIVDVPRGAISAGACTITDTRRDTAVCGGMFPNLSGAVVWPSATLVGEIRIYTGEEAPDKWLFCRGQELSTSAYPDLFTVVGYAYGGSGSSFNLPDLRLRFPRGIDPEGSTSEKTLGRKGGGSLTLTTENLPSHSHTLSGLTGTISASKLTYNSTAGALYDISKDQDVTDGGWSVADGSLTGLSGSVGETGGGQAATITPKFQNINYIIYTGVSGT